MKSFVRPPGPKSRGIAGNFVFGGGDPLGTWTRWAREYGDIFYYRSFHRHVYVVNNPDLIKTILVTDYPNFIKGNVSKIKKRVLGNGLVMSDGDFWLKQRRLIQPAFHHSRIEAYGKVMAAYTKRMLSQWRDQDVRDMHREMMQVTMEIVAKTIFGVELTSEVQRIAAAIDVISSDVASGRPVKPFARFLPSAAKRRHERAATELDDIVYGLIKSRRASGERGEDLLSTLLSLQGEDGSFMSDVQVRDEMMTLLLAGFETTAISLSWTFYLLGQDPEVEEKLQEELQRVLEGRAPETADYARLPYTQAVIKEAMRLYPPVSFLLRSPIKDCELGGYTIPRGSVILLIQWVMHRDGRYFPEPERFHPERWMDRQVVDNAKMTYFPFGGGPRGCIGASYTMMEAVLVLASIAQQFQVSVVPGFETKPAQTFTLRPISGVKVRLTKRKTAVSAE